MKTLWPVASLLVVCAAPRLAEAQTADGGRMRSETPRTIVEFDEGTLTAAEVVAFAELADRGVADIEGLVEASLPAWAKRTRRVRFIIDPGVPMSRAYRNTIVLPLERVRTRSAPYLHETVHVLVPSRGDSLWLTEGFACYLESWVSENRGGYDAQVFTRAGDHGIHAAAQRYLTTEGGRAVLPWVGARGQPPRVEEDRAGVARPFYVLSQSLTKYLVDTAGLDVVVRLLVSGENNDVDISGRSAEQWKADWLRALGAKAAERPQPEPEAPRVKGS